MTALLIGIMYRVYAQRVDVHLLMSKLLPPLMSLAPPLCCRQVDIKNQGKTALQVAAHQGHMEVVKALLQANSSIEVKDEDGDTALHYTAFG